MKAIAPALSRALTAPAASLHAFSRFAGALALVVPLAASAQIWTGIAGDGSLINNLNWSATFTPSSTTDIIFGLPTPNAAQVITIPGSFSVRDVTFLNDLLRPAYTFNGTGSPVVTINGNVAANGVAADVTFANTVGLALSAGSHTIDVGGGAYLRVNGVVADSGGAASIVKTGLSTLVLSGTNTFTGKTTINSGFISIAADRGLGVAPASAVADQLTLNGGALQTTANLTLNSNRGITVSGSSSLNPAGGTTLTYGGVITGSGALALQDGGTLVLTGANTYSGTFTNIGSILQIGNGGTTGSLGSNIANSGALVFNRSNSLTYGGVLSGGGTVEQKGAGTLTLSGTNTYTGKTTISAGTISIADETGLGGNPASATADQLTLKGGTLKTSATLSLDDANRGITLGTGGGTFDVANSTTLTIGDVITGAGGLTKSGGTGSLILTGANTYTGGTTIKAGTLSLGLAGTLPSGGALNLAPSSSTTATFSLGAEKTQAIGALNFSGSNSGSVSSVTIGVSSTLTLGGDVTYNSSGNPGAATISGGGTLALGASRTFNVGSSTSTSSELTVSSAISGASFGLTKTGTGNLALSGTNTYGGGTTVSAGTLTLGSAGALPSSGDVAVTGGTLTVNAASTVGGALSLGGTDNTTAAINGSNTLTLGGNVTYNAASHPNGATISSGLSLGSASRTFTVGDSADADNDLTISGALSGSGSLIKAGAGTLALSGSSNSTAGLTANAGTIGLGTSGARGTAAWVFNNDTILDVTGTGTSSTPILGGASTVTTTFNNTASLTALNSYAIGGGTLNFNDQATLTASSANVIVGGTQIFTAGNVGGPLNSESFSAAAVTALHDTGAAGTSYGDLLDTTAHLTVDRNSTAPTISGGTQEFHGYASLQANHTGAISTGSTQKFYDSSHLRVSRTGSIQGGTQNFYNSSFLWAKAAETVTPTQTQLITSGTQNFWGSSSLWAASNLAVTGGTQNFYNSSGAYANATSSISGVTLNLYDSSFVKLGVANGLDATTSIYFSGANNGAGGTLTLNGFSTTLKQISSGTSPSGNPNPGKIENASSLAATLKVGDTGGSTTSATFSGLITDGTGGGMLSLEKVGTNSTLVLSGANTFTGSTTISAGTLKVSNTLALQNSSVNASGGTLAFDTGIAQATIGSLAGSQPLALTYASENAVALTAGGNGASTSYSGAISGLGSLNKTGVGTLTLSGNNNYAGATTVSGGTLSVTSATALGGTSQGTTVNTAATLNLNGVTIGNEAVTISGFGVGGSGAITATGTASLAGPITLTGTSGMSGVGNAIGGSGTLTLTGAIGEGTAGLALTKVGPGVLVLSQTAGTNTYTGGTNVANGTLRIGATNALPTNTVLGVQLATLDVANSQTIQRFGPSGPGSSITVALGKIFGVALGDSSGNNGFTGVISGAGAFEVGASTTNASVSLLNENTYTGDTIIDSGGTLRLTSNSMAHTDGALAPESHVQNSGTLMLDLPDPTKSFTFANTVSGSGQVTYNSEGLTKVTGNSDYTGATSIEGGTALAKNNNAFGTGPITVNDHATLAVDSGITVGNTINLISGGLAGSGTFNNATIGANGAVFPESTGSNTIATLGFHDLTLAGGGAYIWNIVNPTSGPGVGWDYITVSNPSTLTISATSASPFLINVVSLSAAGVTGAAGGFSVDQAYQWTILTANNDLTASFAANKFLVDASAFTTNLGPSTLSLTLGDSGHSLILNFTPVPEPSTWALLISGLGVLALGARRRLRRR